MVSRDPSEREVHSILNLSLQGKVYGRLYMPIGV